MLCGRESGLCSAWGLYLELRWSRGCKLVSGFRIEYGPLNTYTIFGARYSEGTERPYETLGAEKPEEDGEMITRG